MQPNLLHFNLIFFFLFFGNCLAYNTLSNGGGGVFGGRKEGYSEMTSPLSPNGPSGSAHGPNWDYSWGWGSSPGNGWAYGSGSGMSPTGFGKGFGFGFGSGSGSSAGSGSGFVYVIGRGGTNAGGYGSEYSGHGSVEYGQPHV